MPCIQVRLFNSPIVEVDGKRIFFPFRKAEALFYYLLVEGQSTRDELVDLLWPNMNQKAGKRNLRNAMYQIRKTFNIDIIVSPQRSVVSVNPNVEINTDLQKFINLNNIENYRGEFLQGFSLGDAVRFDEWIQAKREYYKGLCTRKLFNKINNAINSGEYDDGEKYAKKLIELDEFNEEAYRILMKIYVKKGMLNKSILVFNKLNELLRNELGVLPEPKTQRLLEKVLNIKGLNNVDKGRQNNSFFFGRVKELEKLTDNFNRFKANSKFKSIIISGETGIGKTRLKDKFTDMIKIDDVYLLEANCYQAEENYLLKPWHTIFSKLSNIIEKENINIPDILVNIVSNVFPCFAYKDIDSNTNPLENIDSLKYQIVEDAVIGILRRVAKIKKIILAFDDIQWTDDMSLSILKRIVLDEISNNILFIGLYKTGYSNKIDELVSLGIKYGKLQNIELHRFTENEVMNFIDEALPERKLDLELKERIYVETEGNTFFIVEFLNTIRENGYFNLMNSRIQDVLKTRFIDISEEGKKILNVISLFFDEVDLDILETITGQKILDILDVIEELKRKQLIKEIDYDGRISFKFTHQKLREFVYYNQSEAKRRILHSKIARHIEKQLKGDRRDIYLYSRLIYHFSKTGDKLSVLKYTIKNANAYFDFAHELFPILSNINGLDNKKLYLNRQQASRYLENIDELLKEVKNKNEHPTEIDRLEIIYLHMKGRWLIREGKYKGGLDCIERMIKLSRKIKDIDYLLKGYKQIIYYSIQTHNVELMKQYVEIGLGLAIEHNYKSQIGIFLRLKGLNRLMDGEYEESEELLKRSIEILNELDELQSKYDLNIAASYNYIGEIRRHKMEFSSALHYYDKAITICKRNNVIKGINIFNIKAGQVAFEMGDYERAKEYFMKALENCNDIDFLWGRSIGEGYLALLLIKDGRYSGALEFLKKADNHAKTLKNPYELGLVYRVKAEIRANMDRNSELSNVFSSYLNKSIAEYCNKGINLLKKAKGGYEVNILELIKNRRY
jgi:DNA-binding SARP family transcriptional activator/tetratricopeptide (TPR) repeat protein